MVRYSVRRGSQNPTSEGRRNVERREHAMRNGISLAKDLGASHENQLKKHHPHPPPCKEEKGKDYSCHRTIRTVNLKLRMRVSLRRCLGVSICPNFQCDHTLMLGFVRITAPALLVRCKPVCAASYTQTVRENAAPPTPNGCDLPSF